MALQLTEAANESDIRRAFKRLALSLHPDQNPGQADAAARFRRVLLAYEVLTGKRAPSAKQAPSADHAPSPSGAASAEPGSRPPWAMPPLEELPSEAADGEPLYYPTPEEIRNLGNDETHPGRMMNRLALIFIVLVVLWAALAALGPPPGAPRHPIGDELQRGPVEPP